MCQILLIENSGSSNGNYMVCDFQIAHNSLFELSKISGIERSDGTTRLFFDELIGIEKGESQPTPIIGFSSSFKPEQDPIQFQLHIVGNPRQMRGRF